MDHFDQFIDAVPTPMPPRPPNASKGVRDAMSGVCTGEERSDNFVLKWGTAQVPSDDNIQKIMESLETSWQYQLNVMGHAHPYGSSSYLFNVYIGDSGGCAPSARGMGGYYTTDSDGWPFIVLSQGVFNYPESGITTVAHEFYHAVQDAEGAYRTGYDVQWWWEATAMWAEGEVYAATEDYYKFLHGYAFQPHHQLNAFESVDSVNPSLDQYHQYGASIWPRYLTEYVTDWRTIRNSWSMAQSTSDPIEIMRVDLATELGLDLDVVFGDFAAHNATWDYHHGDNISDFLEYIADTSMDYDYEILDQREVAVLGSRGTSSGLQRAPSETLPERYGYNIIRLYNPPEGDVIFRFEGDSVGSDDSEAGWQVRVVTETPSRVRYATMEVEDYAGELELETVGTEENLYLVVAAISPRWNEGETFGYRYEVEVDSVSSGQTENDGAGASGTQAFNPGEKGGGCSVQPASTPGFMRWLGLAALLGFRRRTELQ